MYNQQDIYKLSTNDKLAVLLAFKNSTSGSPPVIDKNTAINLGRKLPANTSLSSCAAVLSNVPIQIINNAQPQDLINSISQMDTSNMDESRLKFLTNKVIVYIYIFKKSDLKLNLDSICSIC